MSFWTELTDFVGLTNHGAKDARNAQSAAIAQAQSQLAESNIRAAELIAGGQHEAAAAIVAAGEKAAHATLKAARLAREQIQKFFEIAQADIAEKLTMSRNDIIAGRTTAREVLNPYNRAGLNSFRKMTSMLGVADDTGRVTPYDWSELEQSPQYQFNLAQGLKAIDRGTRNKLSGGQYKALQEYGSGLASNEFDKRITQLLNASNIGVRAAGGIADADMRAAGMLSSANMGAAGALATTAGNAGNQNAQIAMDTGRNLGNIALGTGNALAQNATSTANALAGLESKYGADTANLLLGQGAVDAQYASNNRFDNTFDKIMSVLTLTSNPLMTSKYDYNPFGGQRGVDWGTEQMYYPGGR